MKRKRVGRGPGSGHGKTSTRGHNGQKARSKIAPWFEGGQMPLTRRLPKRGFTRSLKQKNKIVNLESLSNFKENEEITPELLREVGLVKGRGKIKILACGQLDKPLKVKAHFFSKKAREKIEKIKGTVEVI